MPIVKIHKAWLCYLRSYLEGHEPDGLNNVEIPVELWEEYQRVHKQLSDIRNKIDEYLIVA
jgi:hypothetical protein